MKRWCALLPLVLALGCPPSDPEPVEPPPATDSGSGEGDSQRARAKQAAQELGKRLKARLREALQAGGPAAGIAACKLAAPDVTGTVAEEQGLRVGRTSFKLRNPENTPPEWAVADVAARRETPAFHEGEDGSLRALLPITLEATCTLCHGPAESLSSEVVAALAEGYPDDQATGFEEGDLRGWFWVEVPAAGD